MEHTSKPKRFWSNYREAVRRNFRNEPLDRYSVQADPSGLRVSLNSCRGLRGRTDSWHIPWPEIRAIAARKSDNLTYDTIWISIHTEATTAEERAAAVFPDTAEGWRPVLEALPRHLPSCEPFESWFAQVAFPAFAENGRLIFERAAA
jgi:hypothetical protein